MTSQMCDFFDYQEIMYCLMGYTGGNLPRAEDYNLEFRGGSTATWAGYCMWYGIRDNNFVVRGVAIQGEVISPIPNQYKITEIHGYPSYDVGNPIISFTGYVLFSDAWMADSLYYLKEGESELYEAEISEGKVIRVEEISSVVRENIANSGSEELGNLYDGQTKAEWLASVQRVWDITARILPRRHDNLYKGIWYVNFKEAMEYLQREI